jgi:hypothetical protein
MAMPQPRQTAFDRSAIRISPGGVWPVTLTGGDRTITSAGEAHPVGWTRVVCSWPGSQPLPGRVTIAIDNVFAGA